MVAEEMRSTANRLCVFQHAAEHTNAVLLHIDLFRVHSATVLQQDGNATY